MAFGLFKKKTYADSVFKNGRLYTLDPETEGATAVACKGGKIMRVGSDADMEDLMGPDTEVKDLEGMYLTPGFIDLTGCPAELAAEGSYLKLDPGMTTTEAAAAIESWHKNKEDLGYVLACGWYSGEESIPEIDELLPEVPVVMVGSDGLGMRLNKAAQKAVKARLEAEPFAQNVTPLYVFDTIVSMDYTLMGEKASQIAYDYARRGYTSAVNLGTYTYFDNMYRDMLLEEFHAGLLKQRYFGSLPLCRTLTPLSVMYNLDRKQTSCSELEGLIRFNLLNITAKSGDPKEGGMSAEYLKDLSRQAADKGFSIRIAALDKDSLKGALSALGDVSAGKRKSGFTAASDLGLTEEERADIFTGDVFEDSLAGPVLKGSGSDMLNLKTQAAAARLGALDLGTISEGKSADFAVFSTDPTSLSTAEEFKSLTAEMTVLAGNTVYVSGSSRPETWTAELNEAMRSVFADFAEETDVEV